MWTDLESGNIQDSDIHRLSSEKILLSSRGHRTFNAYFNQLNNGQSATIFTKCLLGLISLSKVKKKRN